MSYWLQGQATDIAIQAEEIIKLKKMLNQLMSQHTGQPVDLIGALYTYIATAFDPVYNW